MKTALLLLLSPGLLLGQTVPSAAPPGSFAQLIKTFSKSTLSTNHGSVDLSDPGILSALDGVLRESGMAFEEFAAQAAAMKKHQTAKLIVDNLKSAAGRFLEQARALAAGADPAPLEARFGDLIVIEALFPPDLRKQINESALILRKAAIDWAAARGELMSLARREAARLRFLGAQDRAEKERLARTLLGREFGLYSPMDVLLFLHPEHRAEIEDFYALKDIPSPRALASSVFADPASARDWAENARRLKALSPEAYAAAKGQGPNKDLASANFQFLSQGRERGFCEEGYRLPYALDPERASASPGEKPEAVPVAQRSGSAERARGLRERYAAFDRFIDSNFQVLQTMASGAGNLTRASARLILAMTRRLAWRFSKLGTGPKMKGDPDPEESIDRIGRRLRRGWASLQADEKLPQELADAVLKLDPANPSLALHSLVNWMHQKALGLFGFKDAQYDSVSGTIGRPSKSLSYSCLAEDPLGGVLARSPALKGLMAGLRRMPSISGQLFFDETRLWLHSRLGLHSVEIFMDGSEPDEGGILRIRYKESGYQGSPYRMSMVESFLKGFGFSVEIEGKDFLKAVWDKDHGLDSERSLAEAFPLIVRFLHDTRDFDLMFGGLKQKDGHDKAQSTARLLGQVYFAEGAWPFKEHAYGDVPKLLDRYLEDAPARGALRARLDLELARLGLPPIPAEVLFGQRAVDRYFTRPVLEARAREGFSIDDLSGGLGDDAARASVLNALDSSFLAFEPAGLAGALRAERAQRWLDDGSVLTVHALREPSSGRLAFARVSLGKRLLGPDELKELLRANGEDADAEEALTSPQMERLQAQLREPLSPEARPSALGLPASPGDRIGPVTFDRSNPARGSILAVPYTSPDDLEAIGRCAGVITTGGGALSHAAITTRELGLPSVILPSARWRSGSLEVKFTRRGPPRTLDNGVQAADLAPLEDPDLREGDVVRIDGLTGEVILLARAGEPYSAEARAAPSKPKLSPPKPREFDGARAGEILRARPSVLRLDEVDDGLKEFVGGKSAKLGEMLTALKGQEAYVPEGIALTYWAYERFLEEAGIKETVAALARELDGSAEVERLSAEMRKTLLSARLNPDKGVGKEILEALRPADQSLWAVRSSAIQEDQDDAAFAGAAESYLSVKPGEILSKVVENWASFWLPRGILYRRQHGLLSAELKPATLIQRMVPAEKSGVIFTRNPVTSADEIVINAVYGLGEGAVSGAAEADSYTARRSDGEETALAHVARKRSQVLETGLRPVPKPLRGKRVLTREQTRDLSRIAAAIEDRFGRPMDIEFSIFEGKIVVLQARPITTG
jgi:hypothetical protein